jgi:hypothetical protein
MNYLPRLASHHDPLDPHPLKWLGLQVWATSARFKVIVLYAIYISVLLLYQIVQFFFCLEFLFEIIWQKIGRV